MAMKPALPKLSVSDVTIGAMGFNWLNRFRTTGPKCLVFFAGGMRASPQFRDIYYLRYQLRHSKEVIKAFELDCLLGLLGS